MNSGSTAAFPPHLHTWPRGSLAPTERMSTRPTETGAVRCENHPSPVTHGHLSVFHQLSSLGCRFQPSVLLELPPNTAINLSAGSSEPPECSWKRRLITVPPALQHHEEGKGARPAIPGALSLSENSALGFDGESPRSAHRMARNPGCFRGLLDAGTEGRQCARTCCPQRALSPGEPEHSADSRGYFFMWQRQPGLLQPAGHLAWA